MAYTGLTDAGWSSSVARWAHNPEVAGSNPVPATEHSGPEPTGSGPECFPGFPPVLSRWQRSPTRPAQVARRPPAGKPGRSAVKGGDEWWGLDRRRERCRTAPLPPPVQALVGPPVLLIVARLLRPPHRSCGLSGSESAQPHAPNGLGRTGPRRTRPRGGDTDPVRGPIPGGRFPYDLARWVRPEATGRPRIITPVERGPRTLAPYSAQIARSR